MRDSDIHMMAADYVADMSFTCDTCGILGRLDNVTSAAVTRLLRAHVRLGHGVAVDFENVRSKRDYLIQRRRERALAKAVAQ